MVAAAAKKGSAGFCIGTGLFFLIVLVCIGEVAVPRVLRASIHDALVQDTQSKMDTWLDPEKEWTDNISAPLYFMNLTNGKALLTTTPAPKPHFELINVTFVERSKFFDGAPSEDGDSYLYHEKWQFTAADPADLDLEIVQVNPAYLGAIYQLRPSETAVFSTLAPDLLAMVKLALGGYGAAAVASAELIAAAEATLGEPPGTIATSDDAAAAQFGTGVLMDLQTGAAYPSRSSVALMPSMQALGLCTYVELGSYLGADPAVATTLIGANPFAEGGTLATRLAAEGYVFSGFSMSVAEASAFLTTFTSGGTDQILTEDGGDNADSSTEAASGAASSGDAQADADSDNADAAAAAELPTCGSFYWGAPCLALFSTYVTQYLAAVDAADAAEVARLGSHLGANATTAAHESGTTTAVLWLPTFGTMHVTPLDGGGGGDAEVGCSSSAGGALCPLLAAAYLEYLTVYLPETLFVGCRLLGCADGASCMNDDGTHPLNGGLLVRRTVRELMHGWDDPLFGAVPASSVPVGVELEFRGLMGRWSGADTSLQTLRDAFVAGDEDAAEFSYEFLSGKRDITDANVWKARKGQQVAVPGDDGYPGWGDSGVPGEAFKTTGLRYIKNQPPQTRTNSPLAMVDNGYKSRPAFNASMTFFLTSLRRPMTIGCADDGLSPDDVADCPWHSVKGQSVLKFRAPDDVLLTTLNGRRDTACRGTVSAGYMATGGGTSSSSSAAGDAGADPPTGPTCDWLLRHDGVANLELLFDAPLAVTMAFMSQCDAAVRDAVSITAQRGDGDGEQEELHWSEEADELALFVEPITGLTIRGYERLQTNWYVERSMLDSRRYANLFSADTDNGDTFVWPYLYVKRQPEISDENAKDFRKLIYGAYDVGAALDCIGFVLFLLCTIMAIIMFGGGRIRSFGGRTRKPPAALTSVALTSVVA